MTQIEEVAEQVFRAGMTEQDFFQQMFAELMLRNRAIAQGKSIEEVKKEVGKDGVCNYELWIKGLTRSIFKSGELIKRPADVESVLSNSYTYRRHTNFPDYTPAEKERMNAMMVDTPDVCSFEQGGFCFRTLKGWKKPGHSLARFQINADMKPEMIKDLDNFIKRYNSVYKTTFPEDWCGRTDTLNIYMYEPVTDNIKKEIVRIMAPYIRRSKPSHINSIDGELLADGIGIARTATPEELRTLINRFPSHLKREVKNYFAAGVSLGVIRTAEEFLDMYKKYAPRFQSNTLVSKTKDLTPQNIPQGNSELPSSKVAMPVVVPKSTQKVLQPSTRLESNSTTARNSIAEKIREIVSEIRSARSELVQLRQSNLQLKQRLAKLNQENTQLRSQKGQVSSSGMIISPTPKSPNGPTI